MRVSVCFSNKLDLSNGVKGVGCVIAENRRDSVVMVMLEERKTEQKEPYSYTPNVERVSMALHMTIHIFKLVCCLSLALSSNCQDICLYLNIFTWSFAYGCCQPQNTNKIQPKSRQKLQTYLWDQWSKLKNIRSKTSPPVFFILKCPMDLHSSIVSHFDFIWRKRNGQIRGNL